MGKVLGAAALSTLMAETLTSPALAGPNAARDAGVLGNPHFVPTAKRVINLFMSGGPPQMDMFDYKPGLGEVVQQRPAGGHSRAPRCRRA